MNVLVVDNFDSFTYNLVEQVRGAEANVTVVRNNDLNGIAEDSFDKAILSPGPGIPEEAGQLMNFIDQFAQRKPILGVCLGHQALGQYFGSELQLLETPVHGKSSIIRVNRSTVLYQDLPDLIEVGRYHSWVVEKNSIPKELRITSLTEDGLVMSFEHSQLPLFGVQYHPESIMSPLGNKIVSSFLTHHYELITA
ncbi:MAG: aminodeoxychorismate/anthranilate synthase component II [Flavobacteriales bacterium]|nr:aminodeoxychorismate/anthranilate synthase component II [Flavobacteriales bacterium]